jgi:hypothetical protein
MYKIIFISNVQNNLNFACKIFVNLLNIIRLTFIYIWINKLRKCSFYSSKLYISIIVFIKFNTFYYLLSSKIL